MRMGNAVYGGVTYSFRDGLTLEAGWRHEYAKMSEVFRLPPFARYDSKKTRANTIYANVSLEF